MLREQVFFTFSLIHVFKEKWIAPSLPSPEKAKPPPSEFQQLFNPLLKFHGNLTDSTLELHFKNWEEPKNVPSLSSKPWSNNQIKLHNVCYMAYRHWPINQLGLK